MKGINTGTEVFLEEIPIKIYRKICQIVKKRYSTDKTFRSTVEYFYFGKNPLRCTNLTYWVRDGCCDFFGQVNRQVPDGVSVHFHDLEFDNIVSDLEKMGIVFETGDRHHLKNITVQE